MRASRRVWAATELAQTRIRSEISAVAAGVDTPWSHGQVEGQINRLKMIKRRMFGRAGFELVDADGQHASKVKVRFGRAPVNRIEIIAGLQPGGSSDFVGHAGVCEA